MRSSGDFRFSRRDLLIVGAASLAAPAAAVTTAPFVAKAEVTLKPAVPGAPVMSRVSFNVNGKTREIEVDTRTTLLDALREHLHFTGTKKGCDHGQCGACTVLLDGRRANSCLALAVAHDGAEIVTAEGLAENGDLHPMQRSFIEHDGYQCGYCTPGQIVSAVGMLDEVEAGWPSHVTGDVSAEEISLSDAEIRERMSGNLCRCGAYANIVPAIREAAEERARR
jgi:xanthine dehydrogenase YagT iron-sulfur-binding subunit